MHGSDTPWEIETARSEERAVFLVPGYQGGARGLSLVPWQARGHEEEVRGGGGFGSPGYASLHRGLMTTQPLRG